MKRLKGPKETDAEFLVRRLATLGKGTFEKEAAWESARAAARPRRRDRTRPRGRDACLRTAPVVFQTLPLDRGRPDVRRGDRAAAALPSRPSSPREAARYLDLAKEAMVAPAAGPRRVPVGRSRRRPPRPLPGRPHLRRDRRRPRAAAPPRVRLRVPDAQERRPDRLRPHERALRLLRDRLQRLRDVPRRRVRPRLRQGPLDDARPLRVGRLHDLPVPARRLRQPRGARVRGLVVLPQARLRPARPA